MKKRKFIICLNFVTIFLSICAIAIGVYSITTATLNVNGAIGFTAHECNVDIVASMYGDSAASDSSTADSIASGVLRSKANAKVYDTIGVYSSTETLNLGTLYFCDKTENGKISPITLSFSITNKSAYNYIDVKVNQKCINNNRISIFAPNNGETIAPRETITITIQFQLQKVNGEYSSLDSAISLSNATLLNFEKSQAPAYLATDWKDKIKTGFNISDLTSIISISFLRELKTDTLNGFNETPISVGAVNETSAQSNLTDNTSVTDVFAYYNSTSIIIYSPARIYAPESCASMFGSCEVLKSLDLSNFDTSKVTDMSSMFYGCKYLTSLDVSNFDTSKVTDMSSMFLACKYLTSLDVSNFDTSNVTNMSSMFLNCVALTSIDVSNLDTSKVEKMSYMFSGCSVLASLDVSKFNTISVTSMNSMFNNCTALTSLDVRNFDTSKVTDMSSMFSSCIGLTSIDVSNLDTSKVEDMSYMFYYCSGLTSLDLSYFDTSKVTNMKSMFFNCSALTSLDVSNFNTSNVTNMSTMFMYCSALKTIKATSGKWVINSGCDTTKMFEGCGCSSVTYI